MPIRLKLDHLMLDRRMTLTELSSRVGLTLANLSILNTNKAPPWTQTIVGWGPVAFSR